MQMERRVEMLFAKKGNVDCYRRGIIPVAEGYLVSFTREIEGMVNGNL